MPNFLGSFRNLMGRLALFVGVIALMAFRTNAAEAPATSSSSKTRAEEAEVMAVDDEYVAAELSRDEAALRRLIDERFVYNSAKGITSGKEEMVQHVMTLGMVDQKISERSVVIEGDVALVFATTELKFGGPGKPESVSTQRYTCAYIKRDGQWRMLALQMQPRSTR